MDNKRAHLAMIQGIINRLSQNSFLLKGWSVVLISALFALAAKEAKPIFVYLAYFPASVFWGLDGYFLWQERMFRALYNKVSTQDDSDINFSMDTSQVRHEAKDWVRAVFSLTLVCFHGAVVGTIVLIMFLACQWGVKNG